MNTLAGHSIGAKLLLMTASLMSVSLCTSAIAAEAPETGAQAHSPVSSEMAVNAHWQHGSSDIVAAKAFSDKLPDPASRALDLDIAQPPLSAPRDSTISQAPVFLEPSRPDIQPLPENLPTPPTRPTVERPPSSPPEANPTPASNPEVKIQSIEVLGSTVFSAKAIQAITDPFIGKPATFEQLLDIRTAVTDLYTKRGYTTSGAFLPPQEISSGQVKVQVIEGELERIEITGLHHLKSSYVRQRVGLAAKPPVNIRQLEQALQLLQIDPLFTSVQAELKAGTSPGKSVLTLNLKEAKPLHLDLSLENRDSPSVGEIRGTATLSHQNLLGFGDRLSLETGFTRGVDSYEVGYELPLTAQDGRLNLRYANNKSELVEKPFSELDINSESESFSIGFRQPLTRTPTNEFALGLTLDLRRSQTFLLKDIPFSFSSGPEDGKSKVSVLRFSQDWINRSPTRVLAARSQFSLGLNAFGATDNDTGTDGQFFSWVGQLQWVQNLGKDVISIARIATQLSGDSLLPLEQFSIGGADTVRGYRQNQRVGDSGIIGSWEIRVPVVRDPNGFGSVQIAPFVEIGNVWTNKEKISSPSTLASVGLGLRWQIAPTWSARLDWGIPLIKVKDQGDSLQDSGLHFSLQLQPF